MWLSITSLIPLFIVLSHVQAVFCNSEPEGNNFIYIVSKDGSGDFKTVQEAFNALPDSSSEIIHVFIKKGVYKEKLVLPSSKINVMILGEYRDSTMLTYDDFSGRIIGQDTLTTHNSCSFRIDADGFTARNMTFQNTAGTVAQAVAVEVNSDKVSFFDCRFLGNQDTYYTNSIGRIYMKNCYIEGTTDFIFGKSIAVFDNCKIHSKKDSYVTAASTPEGFRFGYVFRNCILTADTGIHDVYLGRPWRDFARIAFIQCYLGGHILPEGWHNWNKPWREKSAYYAEYRCIGPGSERSGRVSWSYELSDEQAKQYTLEKIFAKESAYPEFKEDWLPESDL
jgi:pectinesterase